MAFLRSFGRFPLLLSSCRTTASIKSCSVFSSQLVKFIPDRTQQRLAYHSLSSPRGLSGCHASVCYDSLFQWLDFISKTLSQFRQSHSSAQTLLKDWQLALQRLRNIKSPTSDQLVQFTEAVSPYLQKASQLQANDLSLRSYAPLVAQTLQHFAFHLSKNARLRENMKIYLQNSGSFLARWYEAAEKSMEFLNPSELSAVLYAHVYLDILPQHHFLILWNNAALVKMGNFDAKCLSNILYAHGKLELAPSEDFLPGWYGSAAKKFSQFIPQALYNIINAHGLLKTVPPHTFLQQWYAHATARLGEFDAQGLSNSVYAFSQFDLPPSETFLNAWYEAALIILPQFTIQGLSNCFYAFSQFGLKPRPDFRTAWYWVAMRVLHEATEQALSNIIYAHFLLKLVPPEDFFKRWQDIATPLLTTFTEQGLSNSIYAIALLKLKPEETFLKSWYAAVLVLIHTFIAKGLCSCVYALAQLNAKLSRDFVERWCNRATKLGVSKFEGSEIFHCLFALSQPKVAVSSELLKQLSATVVNRFEEADNPTLWLRMCITIAKNFRGDDEKLRKNCR